MRFDFWAGAAFGVGVSLLWSWTLARAKFHAQRRGAPATKPPNEA